MADQHKTIRVPVRKRPQQYRIHDAEDRAVGANAQRQYQHGNTGKAGIFPQRPHAISNVLNKGIDKSDSTHLAVYLLQQCDVSELASGGPSGLGLGHPLVDISLGEQAHVRLDLIVELLIRSAISEQSPKSRHKDAQIMDHLYPWPSNFNSRPITPAIRSQFSVSSASCLRPLFVIE